MNLSWDEIAFGVAIYFIIWWVTLFMVLPFGITTQDEANDTVLGTVSSAPVKTRMKRVVIINTLVASAVFAVFCYFTVYLGYGLKDIPWFGPPIS